ncbi:MAG: hypothetical protein GSR84_04545 [Desulfurococcales archaeon]|nr:hypothetical protein [Desulfurococcales archaeon]
MLEEIVKVVVASLIIYAGFGFFTFVALVRSQLGGDWGWLRSMGERLAFFLAPTPPRNMVILTELDGETHAYYNVKIEKADKAYEIHLPHAKYLAPKIKESWSDLLGSNYPVPESTPYNLAIRAIGGLMVGAYMIYLMAISGGLGLVETQAGQAALVAAAILAVAHTLLAYRSAMIPNLKVVELVELGISSPGTRYALPSIGPRGMSPVEFAKLQAYELKVEVPREVKELYERLLQRYKHEDLALAKLLALAEEAERLKVEISEVKRREVYSQQMARAYFLQHAIRVAFSRPLALFLAVVIGIVIGYALGGGDIVFVGQPPAPQPAPTPMPNASVAGVPQP